MELLGWFPRLKRPGGAVGALFAGRWRTYSAVLLANGLGGTANERWLLGVLHAAGSPAADLKARLNATSSPETTGTLTLPVVVAAPNTSISSASAPSANAAGTTTANGSLDWQVAQQAADATPTPVRAGSWIKTTRIG